MKIKILATALCALALGFSACDDDDDDAIISNNPSQDINGLSYQGVYQVINSTTKDTTYVKGSVSFASTDEPFVCQVTAVLEGDVSAYNFTSSGNANVVKTSNGYSFYVYPTEIGDEKPIGDYGFNGFIENGGETSLYFDKFVRKGLRVTQTAFLFSNTKWNDK